MSGGATQRRAGLARENRRLRTANAALRRQLGVERAKNRRLEQRVRDLQRERWGKKSERTPVPPLAPAKPPTTWPEKRRRRSDARACPVFFLRVKLPV